MMRMIALTLALTALAFGCSGAEPLNNSTESNHAAGSENAVNKQDDDQDEDSSDDVTEDEAARAFAEATQDMLHRGRCEAVFECPEQSPEEVVAHSRYTTVEECLADRRPLLRDLNALLIGVESGRATFDADRAEVCLRELQTIVDERKCRGGWPHIEAPRSCERLFEGTLETGGDCTSSEECQLSDFCDKPVVTNWEESCFGTCVERSPNCGDLWCDPLDTFCSDSEECEPRRAEGESCANTLLPQCDLGLICDESSGEGVCIPKYSRGEGEPCSTSRACEAELYCDNRTCVPHPNFRFVGLGEACDRYPDITEFGGSADLCSMGLVCDSESAVCVTPAASGEGCSGSRSCEAGNYCVPVDAAGDPGGPRACVEDATLLTAICTD